MAIPAADLALMRASGQTSKLYLVVQQPQYLSGSVWTGYEWSARIDGAHNDDPTVTLTVDNGTAAVDLLDGMTVLVGSAYGEWDSGVFRVRGDQSVGPGTTELDIGTSSDVRGNVSDDDYLVVLDEVRFWQRYGRIEVDGDDIVWYKDYDIAWDDLGANDPARRLAMMPPVPIMTSHCVKFVETDTDSCQFYWDWSYSYATAPGEAITTWTSEGETDHAGGTWNSAAQTPGWQTVDAISGLRGFRVTLEVDDGNGNATTLPFRRGVRYVFSLRRPGETQDGDPPNAEPIVNFTLNEPITGSFDSGYWNTSITVYADEADKYTIMPEALVIVFSEDTYTNTDGSVYEGSLGLLEDRENILFVGRIVGASIRKDPETGDVTFDVASPGAESALYHNYPVVIQNDDDGTTWIDTPDLTVDRAMHYYTTWHTNLNQIADLYQTGETTEIYAQDFLEGTIYQTLNQFLWERRFGRLLCDKFGRFFGRLDAQYDTFGTAATDWTMQEGDWLEEALVRQNLQTPVNAVDCGGLIYTPGADDPVTPKLSRSPGLFDRYRGSKQESNALAIDDQDDLNTLTGRFFNGLNHTYEIDFKLAGNWRWMDFAPQRTVDIGTLETERGDLTGDYLIRGVTNTYDPEAGTIFTDIQTVQEMDDGVAGVTIPIPDTMPDPDYTPTWPTSFETVVPIGDVPQYPRYGPWLYVGNNGYYTSDVTASPPVWALCASHAGNGIYKTCMMYSETTNRFFGYGESIFEYQDLPLDTGAWTELMTDDEIATEFGIDPGDLLAGAPVWVFRMQFSIRPGQEGWAWAGVCIAWDDGTEYYTVGVLHTQDAWDSVTYATTLYTLEDGVDFDASNACNLENNGLALDMHSNTVYVCCGLAPDWNHDGGDPQATYDGWWRLYVSQNFGYSFTLAQDETYEWGTDGYEHAGFSCGFCDVWVPWVSNTYQGGAVFWTAGMLDTSNNSTDIELDTLIYRSLNHGLSMTRIGDDGGLDQGLNFLGGPWNSLDRVFGGLSMDAGLDADQTKIWTWLDGAGWTEFRDTNTPTWDDCLMHLVTAQSGYTLSSCICYEDPYYIQSGSDESKLCTSETCEWFTVVSM